MNRLPILSVGLILLAACSVEFTEPSGRRCDDSHACPQNEVCVDLRCQASAITPSSGEIVKDGGHHPDIQVGMSPRTAGLGPTRTQRFTATVLNASNRAVTWKVLEGPTGGTIDANGLYTAPDRTGTYHVEARSVEDPSRSAIARVNVTEFPTGLVLHFAADRLLGDDAELPADGSRISSWVDLSGNAHDLSQTDSSRQPIFKANALNGLPAVAFDGNDEGHGDYLGSAAFASALPQPLTVFLVYKGPPEDTVNKTLMDAPSGAGPNRLRLQSTTMPPGSLQLYTNRFTSPGSYKPAGEFYSATALFNGVNSRLRMNGREEFLMHNRNPGFMGMAGLMLGGRQELTDNAFSMTEIPELLIFNRALSDSEIDQVETYLRSRYFP